MDFKTGLANATQLQEEYFANIAATQGEGVSAFVQFVYEQFVAMSVVQKVLELQCAHTPEGVLMLAISREAITDLAAAGTWAARDLYKIKRENAAEYMDLAKTLHAQVRAQAEQVTGL